MSFDLDNCDYGKIKNKFDRGDYINQKEIKFVKNWLRAQEKEREFIAACERASISAALNASQSAKKANLVALFALLFSVIGAFENLKLLLSQIVSIF